MATYYVRSTGGSDANNGTSYATGWATLGKLLGASGMASGDQAYIAPGTYREVVTVAMTSAVATTRIIADVDGSHTDGIGGEVIWTNFTTNDTSAASASANLNLAGRDFLSFENFTFITGGSIQCVDAFTTAGSNSISFVDCTFLSISTGTLIFAIATVDVSMVWRLTRCTFAKFSSGSLVQFRGPTSVTADYDLDVQIESCLFLLPTAGKAIIADSSAANSFFPGGVKVNRCTLLVATSNGFDTGGVSLSLSKPSWIINSYIASTGGTGVNVNNSGGIIEDNTINVSSTARSGPLTPSNVTTTAAPLFNFGQERIIGRAVRPFFSPMAGSPMLAFGNVEIAVAGGGTFADDATIGSVAWTNPSNAALADASYAVASTIAQNTDTHYLKITNFGFALPATATVTGIRAEVYAKASAASSVSLSGGSSGAKIVKGGTIGGTLLTQASTWTTGDAFYTLGGYNNLWGNTLLYSDVNDSTFGVALAVRNVNAAARDASVNFVRLIVYYTDTAMNTDITGRPRPAGGASVSKTLGAFERHDTGILTTSTTQAGANALDLNGPSDHDFQIPVNAAATTIKVYGRYDGTYSGTLPCATLLANPTIGVTTSTATMVAAANTWEQLTIGPFTPTAAGVVTVRLRNQGTTVSGHAYFDSWSVT